MDGFRHEMLTVEFLTEGCLESCDVAKEPTWMVATFLKAALQRKGWFFWGTGEGLK